MRNLGKSSLKYVLTKEQNIDIIEKNIFDICDDEETYKNILYQVISDISLGKKLQDILEDIKSHKVLWKHESLNDFIKEEEEQDEFIVNPFQIEEGIVECRCGSKRVYSYSKQCRSGDEGVTSFHQCLKCKAKWSLNN
jgi:DNA-directed RNA polymerase subunit M/transcription elongation factor TFIIS